MLYRLKQLYWALTHRLTASERAWIDRALTEPQQPFFYALHPADQAHAYRVAQSVRLNAHYPALSHWEKQLAIQLALLHDIGRSRQRFLIVKKMWHVLLETIPGARHLSPFNHHEALGARRLREVGVADVAELLENPRHPISQVVKWADDFN